MALLVAQEPVQPHRVGPQERPPASSRSTGRRRGRARRAGPGPRGRRPPPTRPALRSVPGLGEQQGPAVGERPAGDAAPGLGRLLLVRLEPPALHEVDDEGDGRRSRAAGTCPAGPTHVERLGRPRPRAAGTAVFSATKLSGRKRWSVAPANSAVSRSAWAWTSGSSGMRSPSSSARRRRWGTSVGTSVAPDTRPSASTARRSAAAREQRRGVAADRDVAGEQRLRGPSADRWRRPRPPPRLREGTVGAGRFPGTGRGAGRARARGASCGGRGAVQHPVLHDAGRLGSSRRPRARAGRPRAGRPGCGRRMRQRGVERPIHSSLR